MGVQDQRTAKIHNSTQPQKATEFCNRIPGELTRTGRQSATGLVPLVEIDESYSITSSARRAARGDRLGPQHKDLCPRKYFFGCDGDRSIISLAGFVGSSNRLACSAPATGCNAGSRSPTCTSSVA